jgi:hypothetical protein
VSFPGWSHVTAVARADDGSFIVGLDQTTLTGVRTAIGVAKLHADATLDTSFGASGPTPGIVQLDLAAYSQAQPTTPVIPLPDGHFFIGTRRYLPDGSVDAGFGANGFMSSAAVGPFTTTWASIVRSSTNRVLVASDGFGGSGCTIYRVGVDGLFDQSVALPVQCSHAVAVAYPGGDTMFVVVNVQTIDLVFVRPNGTLDVSHGGGTGIVTTSIVIPQVLAADLAPDGFVTIVAANNALVPAFLYFVLPDGTIPQGVGSQVLDGQLTSIHIDDASRIIVNYASTFLAGRAGHPTLARYLANGLIDTSFNAAGSTPGFLDTVDLGLADGAVTSPHLALADGRILLPFNPVAGASILVLAPNPPLPPPPPPPPPLNGAASATQPAQRLQRYTLP